MALWSKAQELPLPEHERERRIKAREDRIIRISSFIGTCNVSHQDIKTNNISPNYVLYKE